MLSYKEILEMVDIRELLRAYNSNKDYIICEVIVFSAGTNVILHCTNKYKNLEASWYNSGYDFIVNNDYDFEQTLKDILIKKFQKINSDWTKFCYDYKLGDFLKRYKINSRIYNTLKKLEAEK